MRDTPLSHTAGMSQRMPQRGGALSGGCVLFQRTFQKASHGWDCRHWPTVDPAPFNWAVLSAPHAGLSCGHSESQTHAWVPATDHTGRVCWPGRALSPHKTQLGEQLWPPLPRVGTTCRSSKGPREGKWELRPQAAFGVLGQLV